MRIYRTDNLALAAFLSVNGYELQGITPPQGLGQWHEFAFTSDRRLDEHIQAFFSTQAPALVK